MDIPRREDYWTYLKVSSVLSCTLPITFRRHVQGEKEEEEARLYWSGRHRRVCVCVCDSCIHELVSCSCVLSTGTSWVWVLGAQREG